MTANPQAAAAASQAFRDLGMFAVQASAAALTVGLTLKLADMWYNGELLSIDEAARRAQNTVKHIGNGISKLFTDTPKPLPNDGLPPLMEPPGGATARPKAPPNVPGLPRGPGTADNPPPSLGRPPQGPPAPLPKKPRTTDIDRWWIDNAW